jgi:hypothetical protein
MNIPASMKRIETGNVQALAFGFADKYEYPRLYEGECCRIQKIVMPEKGNGEF